jgi:DNA-3-methyladenine glycosylase
MMSGFDCLNQPAERVARRLLGCELVRLLDGQLVRVRIVETEAYDQTDAASHSYKGRTPRTDVMFGPAGRLYVYFTYGMHYCCNIVAGPEGYGAAVLIRAVEPLEGLAVMAVRRKDADGAGISNGPAKLCQALAISRELNGHDLRIEPLQLVIRPSLAAAAVVQTTRIGISQAKDVPWRFYIKDNGYVSRS